MRPVHGTLQSNRGWSGYRMEDRNLGTVWDRPIAGSIASFALHNQARYEARFGPDRRSTKRAGHRRGGAFLLHGIRVGRYVILIQSVLNRRMSLRGYFHTHEWRGRLKS